MKFSTEEAMELAIELILMAGTIGVMIYFFTKVHLFL